MRGGLEAGAMVADPLDEGLQLIGPERLGEVFIHAGVDALLAVVDARVGGDGGNKNTDAFGLHFANLMGGLVAIHNGHLAIH